MKCACSSQAAARRFVLAAFLLMRPSLARGLRFQETAPSLQSANRNEALWEGREEKGGYGRSRGGEK